MDKQQKAAKGRQTNSLKNYLADPLLVLEQAYMEQITESAFDEADLREHLYHRIRVIKDFEKILHVIIADGQIANADIVHAAKIQTGELKEFF